MKLISNLITILILVALLAFFIVEGFANEGSVGGICFMFAGVDIVVMCLIGYEIFKNY